MEELEPITLHRKPDGTFWQADSWPLRTIFPHAVMFGGAAPNGVVIAAVEETGKVFIKVGDEQAFYERAGFTLNGDWVCEWVGREDV